MNHLVYLDAQAGELEKILSGVKTMLVKEINLEVTSACPVSPGDSLYFLRCKDECALRGKATVVRLLTIYGNSAEELSQALKEMQPRLQLIEEQYNYWSEKKQVLLVEFEAAHKIDAIPMTSHITTYRSDWVPFEAFSLGTE